jgi:hypothetical protein
VIETRSAWAIAVVFFQVGRADVRKHADADLPAQKGQARTHVALVCAARLLGKAPLDAAEDHKV